jgi:tetratricopeptide (TPR) repeat protein/tRNA A-37 threonylcarbamoyl transferase component Bud32
MSGQTDQSQRCLVCGVRPPAEGSVCAECSATLRAAATGPVSPSAAPVFDPVDAVSSGAPTSPLGTPPPAPTAGSSDAGAPREDAGHRYAAGDLLDARYTIIEEIGTGGMGVVYKALDRQLEKTVALKLMRPRAMDPANVARFRRELALAQNVSHSNVCRVHDLGDVEGVLYISMEHVEGQRLDHVIISMGRLSARQTVALGRQLCAGLRAIHEQGIIHRDLKPSNVMVNRSGHVFIMDFGLAVRPGSDKVTSTGAVLGTFAYLSPEQARGLEVGPRSDVYAVGLILYEMLTGVTPPGDDAPLPLALRDAKERCPPPSELTAEVPADLDAVVMRCLERDPGKRYSSAAELEAALGAMQERIGSPTGRIGSRSTARLPWLARGRERTRGLTVAAAAVAVLLTAAWGARHWRPAATGRPRPIVAVMPFTNLSGEASFAPLGVGIADVLITHLAASPDLTVISSPRAGKDGAATAQSVAQELGATHVLSGTLQAASGRVRVALTLLRMRDSVVIGVGEGESALSDVFDLPAGLAEKVIGALDVGLGEAGRQRLARRPTNNAEAFSEYSRAKDLLQQRDVKGNTESAIALLESAVRRDAKFALAHAALGEAYLALFADTKDPQWVALANRSILEALRLDPAQVNVRLSLAMVLQRGGKLGEAGEELRKVLEEQPANDEAHRLLAMVLAEQGNVDGAVAEMQRAIAVRPEYWQHYLTLADLLYRAKRYEPAIAAAQTVIRLRPESDRGYRRLGAAYQSLGDTTKALEQYQHALRIAPSAMTYGNIGTVHYWRGDYAAAAEAYRRAVEITPTEFQAHMNLARAEEQLHSGRAAESYRRALELTRGLLAVNPSDARVRSLAATCELKLGHVDAALKEMDEARRSAPQDPDVLYRACVIYAASGRTANALDALEQAFAAGYSVALAEHGDGLEPLRGRPEFEALLERARQKKIN